MHTLLASTLVIELLRSSRVVRTHYLLAISRAGKHVPNINLSLARVTKSINTWILLKCSAVLSLPQRPSATQKEFETSIFLSFWW